MSCSQWWTCESSLREYRWVMPWNFLSQAESSQGYLGFRPASPFLQVRLKLLRHGDTVAIALYWYCPSFWKLRDGEIVLHLTWLVLKGGWQMMWMRVITSAGVLLLLTFQVPTGFADGASESVSQVHFLKRVARDSQRLTETRISHNPEEWLTVQTALSATDEDLFLQIPDCNWLHWYCGGASGRSTSQGFDNNGTSGTILQGTQEQASALGLPDCHIVVMNSKNSAN